MCKGLSDNTNQIFPAEFMNTQKGKQLYAVTLLIIAMILFLPTVVDAAVDDYIAYWSFDETAGQIAHDYSGNSFHGQVNGATWSEGIRGNCLEFDGADDYVDVTDGNGYPDEIGNLAVGAISLWFKFDTHPLDNTIHPLFYLGDGIGGTGNSSIIIEIGHFASGNDKLYFTILADDAHIPLCYDSGFNLELDTWYHFVVVVGANFNTGYLDGEEITNRHYNFGTTSDSYFFDDIADKQVCWIGKGFLGRILNENYNDGKIDEVRIYDRSLNAEEIKQLFVDGLEILDDRPKTIVVNGYSTSFHWPDLLQQKLDDYFGGQRIIEVVKAVKSGTPIAKWIDVETGVSQQSWIDILQPELEREGPVIVLAQQSLQWVFDSNDRTAGIRNEYDTERIQKGADAIETYVNALKADGADLVLLATHIYKYSMEPEIHNEIYALNEVLTRGISRFERGPDVWTPMEAAWPEAFQSDLVHPNYLGAEIMAQCWFDTLLERKAPWDLDKDKTINFVDFAILSNYWRETSCDLKGWCGGTDFNRDGMVNAYELVNLVDHWLQDYGF